MSFDARPCVRAVGIEHARFDIVCKLNVDNLAHVLLQAGVAMVDVQPDVSFDSSSESTSSSGVGVAPAIGYEWWIGEQWSFGIVGRITFLEATSNRRAFTNVDEKHSIVAPSLLATFVYH